MTVQSTVAIGLLLAVVALAVWRVFFGGLSDAKFVVEVRGPGSDGVTIKGAVPGHDEGSIADFVASLELPVGAKFWGVMERGRVELRFAGVPDGAQQRLRNVIYAKG